MASRAYDFGRASALPLSAMLGAIPSLPRPVLSRLVARMIERLDAMDPDPDAEEDNEDWGGDEGEPEFRWPNNNLAGPGCVISDAGGEDEAI